LPLTPIFFFADINLFFSASGKKTVAILVNFVGIFKVCKIDLGHLHALQGWKRVFFFNQYIYNTFTEARKRSGKKTQDVE